MDKYVFLSALEKRGLRGSIFCSIAGTIADRFKGRFRLSAGEVDVIAGSCKVAKETVQSVFDSLSSTCGVLRLVYRDSQTMQEIPKIEVVKAMLSQRGELSVVAFYEPAWPCVH